MFITLQKLVIGFLLIVTIASRPLRPEESYVEQYKYMAISEMKRTGIPASIKLAQGLMESQSGRSELALNANNHFGIKCKGDWVGDTYDYKDDDTDVNGELIHSCFRKYNVAEQSYIDHSNFLTSRSRYKILFEFDKSDYRSWARGLKTCGYATDPNYADKLIDAIERLNLYTFDQDASIEVPGAYQFEYKEITVPNSPTKIVAIKSNQTIKTGLGNNKSTKLTKAGTRKYKSGHPKKHKKSDLSKTDLLN